MNRIVLLEKHHRSIHRCTRCPRLISHCKKIAREKRRAFADQTYWGKPVSGFGDPNAEILIVGLAPAAHGANRTGRMFTGDRSGEWLYRAIFKAGLSNQISSDRRDDNLKLEHIYITSVAKCAPPQNKPTPKEIQSCSIHLTKELKLLDKVKVFLCLGQIGLNGVWPWISSEKERKPKFKHAGVYQLESGKHLVMSYHPSQQNTFTKRLTEPMFDHVFSISKQKAGIVQ